jgi:hypothetical protein
MAKLEPPFCVAAFEARWALHEGQFEEAKKRAASYLHKGYHSQEFFDVVAELLEGKKLEGKQRRTKLPVWMDWVEVGLDYEEWKTAGRLRNGKKFTHKGVLSATVVSLPRFIYC